MSAWLVLVAVGCGGGAVPAPVAPVSHMPAPATAALEETAEAPAPDRWLAEDKVRHFAASFAATGMAYGGARFALDRRSARTAAVGVALALGLAKELADARAGGPFSLKDLVWDAAGVALGMLLVQRTL